MSNVIKFFKSVYAELDRISWASKRDVAGFTVVVLVLVVAVSFFIMAVDLIISKIVGIFI
ncbi:MAG: preprotein translocase subunit SecE [Candidatus Omnitrophota bacterium]|nr:preprotein translocase subunit SecE [Candidatus Omnitrophota bacterium]MBU2528321.1 preprotein translocase subunit SecE [bacterium]MBU3930034.1 preprotein translocase subunit SecE [bacterium]MBU4123375.1 preprotein translocase subunit SecE [bacterium]